MTKDSQLQSVWKLASVIIVWILGGWKVGLIAFAGHVWIERA
jgi:hypothetical protein